MANTSQDSYMSDDWYYKGNSIDQLDLVQERSIVLPPQAEAPSAIHAQLYGSPDGVVTFNEENGGNRDVRMSYE